MDLRIVRGASWLVLAAALSACPAEPEHRVEAATLPRTQAAPSLSRERPFEPTLLYRGAHARAPAAAATSTPATFHFSPPEYTRLGEVGEVNAVAVGDIDGDGRDDIVVATDFVGTVGFGADRKVWVFRQQANGTLAPRLETSYDFGSQADLAIGDFDHDGRDDIVAGDFGGFAIVRYKPGPGLIIANHYEPDCTYINVLDINADGNLDIACLGSLWLSLRYGDGAGGFVDGGRTQIGDYYDWRDMEAADVTGDGRTDLLLFRQGSASELWVFPHAAGAGFAAGTIYSVPAPGDYDSNYPSTWGMTVGDFNADRRNDVAIATSTNLYPDTHFHVLHQSTYGTFLAPVRVDTGYIPAAMVAADFDGDRDVDLVTDNQGLWFMTSMPQVDHALTTSFDVDKVGGSPDRNSYLAAADVNGDRCTDVVSVDSTNLVINHGLGCGFPYVTGGPGQRVPVGP